MWWVSMCVYVYGEIYCKDLTLCNCGSWLSSLCKVFIFTWWRWSLKSRGQKCGREVGCQVERTRISWNPGTQAGVHEDGLKHTSVLVASDLRVWVSPRSWALVTELSTHTCFLNFLFFLIFLISFLDCTLLVYRNTTVLCVDFVSCYFAEFV